MNKAFNSKFTKGNTQMANKHIIIYPTSIIIISIQIKTTVTYHFTPTVRARDNTWWQGHEQLQLSDIHGVTGVQQPLETVWQFHIKLNIAHDLAIPYPRNPGRDEKFCPQKDLYSNVYSGFIQ